MTGSLCYSVSCAWLTVSSREKDRRWASVTADRQFPKQRPSLMHLCVVNFAQQAFMPRPVTYRDIRLSGVFSTIIGNIF